MSRKVQISVVGGSRATGRAVEQAREVGELLAEAGAVVVCGGLNGVMDAVSTGAREADGDVIGIVPTYEIDQANENVTHVVATGLSHARNMLVVASGDAVIAIDGEWGTLSEIALARSIGRTVVALDGWRLEDAGRVSGAPGIEHAKSPSDAVAIALRAAQA